MFPPWVQCPRVSVLPRGNLILPGVNPARGGWDLIVLAVHIRPCLALLCRLLAQGQRLLKSWEGFRGG